MLLCCRAGVDMRCCCVVEPELLGASSLLRKYIALLCAHVTEVLCTAHVLVRSSSALYTSVADILRSDISSEFLSQRLLNVSVVFSSLPVVIIYFTFISKLSYLKKLKRLTSGDACDL